MVKPYAGNDKRAEKAVSLIEDYIGGRGFKFSPEVRDYAVGTIQGYLNEAWASASNPKVTR